MEFCNAGAVSTSLILAVVKTRVGGGGLLLAPFPMPDEIAITDKRGNQRPWGV